MRAANGRFSVDACSGSTSQPNSSTATGKTKRARQAETAGKTSVAKIYYQLVARRATGDLKQQALDRLKELQ